VKTHENLVDRVYDQIVALINDKGLLMSQEDLGDVRLAQRFGVSRTPVRMALARLESEGLVHRVPGKGWIIASLTLKDIEDIFDLQEILESFAARRAAEKISPDTAADLMKIVDEMKEVAGEGNSDKWFAVDTRFHDLIYEVVGNDRLKRMMSQLTAQWYRFRVGYVALNGQMHILYEEHCRIAEAIVSGDPDLAAESVLEHLRHIRGNLVSILDNILVPFLGADILKGEASKPTN
jgi:DNA-binding GntR family transcriptional regulator